MQNAVTIQGKSGMSQKSVKRNTTKRTITGPSLFEVEYLRQMKEELEVFLRSRNFGTIQAFEIAFTGADFQGMMKVSA